MESRTEANVRILKAQVFNYSDLSLKWGHLWFGCKMSGQKQLVREIRHSGAVNVEFAPGLRTRRAEA
jgi:hypothetical protein